jgi:phage protein U
MLAQLGSVIFEIAPIGLTEIDHGASASFAAHPVLGEMPPLEFTGEGPEEWRLRGTLLPEFNVRAGLADGLADLDALHAMRRSGQAQFLMRGDGVPMGWVVITRVTDRSHRLNAVGVGRIIDVEIDVSRAKLSGADPSSYSGSTSAALGGGGTTDVLSGGRPLGQGGIGSA